MKKSLLTLLGAGLLLTSCQSDEPFAPGEGGEKQVTFTLTAPTSMTRAGEKSSSNLGGLSNKAENEVLHYTLALYYGNEVEYKKSITSIGSSVTFNPTVILGRNYRVVAYADFVGEKADLTSIAIENGINNEKKDAYFANPGNVVFTENDLAEQVTLTRPFGKLRLVATDYSDNTQISNVSVTYRNGGHLNSFNAFKGEFANTTDASATYNAVYNVEYDEETGEKTIFVDYIPVNSDGVFPFEITVTYTNGTESFTRTFAEDIPVKRNALTTLKGNFFTAEAKISVVVDEDFDGGQTVGYYSGVTIGNTNYDSLEEAVAAAKSGAKLRLDGDIVLVYNATRADENFLMEIAKNLTIDLNGKNIKATVGDVTVNSGIFRVVKNGELTIEGEGNIDITTGKAINKLTTFISNEGGIVNLKGGNWTLTSLEYPDALIPCFVDNNSTPGAATLNIYDGTYTFHRNLFRNFANNKNEVATINIFGGTFNGKSNDEGAIWNQKPSASTPDGAGVINVKGGTFNNVVIDDDFGKVSNAVNQTELNSNVATANATIQLEAGTYTFPSTFAEGVTLVCEEGVVFEGKSGLNINGATVIGATFSNPNGVAGAGTIHGTYKDCTFEGSEALRWCYSEAGKTVIFEDCVFNTDFRGVHFDGMDGDVVFKNCEINGFNAIGGNGKVTFEGCTFGNDESNYNGLNMYSNIDIKDCKFNYVSGKTNFIDFEEAGKTMNITNSTATLDGAVADIKDFIGGTYVGQTTVSIDGVKVVFISNAEQLNKLSAKNAYVILKADIDFAGAAMTKPIELWGNSTFDGKGHKISNVTTAVQGGYATSLFRGDANPGNKVVKNLVIDKITTPSGYSYASAIWSDLQGANITIDNVHINNAAISANGTIGGFVGFVSASSTSVIIKDSSIKNSNLTGGEADHKRGAIVGRAYGCVVTCDDVDVDNVKINSVAATTSTLVGDKGYTGTVTVK